VRTFELSPRRQPSQREARLIRGERVGSLGKLVMVLRHRHGTVSRRLCQRGLLKEFIALSPRLFEGTGAERSADAFLGPRRGMHDVVYEPRAVVIPQVMIGILRIGADAQFAHGVWFW
jgi:hypothetical protein